ncbi:hypothetical protein QP257_24130, partial [Escherichia coli]|nr:hypothetical protein [Escherichia coli]
DRNRSHWSTSKTPSYTKSVSWQHHPYGESKGKRKGKEKSEKPEKKDTVEWQLCDPMEIKDSPLRVNLYGKERTVEKKVTPPKPVTTWTIGMDY